MDDFETRASPSGDTFGEPESIAETARKGHRRRRPWRVAAAAAGLATALAFAGTSLRDDGDDTRVAAGPAKSAVGSEPLLDPRKTHAIPPAGIVLHRREDGGDHGEVVLLTSAGKALGRFKGFWVDPTGGPLGGALITSDDGKTVLELDPHDRVVRPAERKVASLADGLSLRDGTAVYSPDATEAFAPGGKLRVTRDRTIIWQEEEQSAFSAIGHRPFTLPARCAPLARIDESILISCDRDEDPHLELLDSAGARTRIASPSLARFIGWMTSAVPSPDGRYVLLQASGDCHICFTYRLEVDSLTVSATGGVDAAESWAAGWIDGREVVLRYDYGPGTRGGIWHLNPEVIVYPGRHDDNAAFVWSDPRPPVVELAPIPRPGEGLADGRHHVWITGIDVPGRTLSVDVAQWLTGDEARRADAEDHGEGGDPFGGEAWYIRNQSTEERTLDVAPNVEVQLLRLQDDGTADLRPGAFEELPTYFQAMPHVEKTGLWYFTFWITVRDGSIVGIEEHYHP